MRLAKKGKDLTTVRRAFCFGLVISSAAAIVGVDSPIGGLPIRPWHALFLLAIAIAFYKNGPEVGKIKPNLIDFIFLAYVLLFGLVEYVNSSVLKFTFAPASLAAPVLYFLGIQAGRVAVRSVSHFMSFARGVAFCTLANSAIVILQVASPGVNSLLLSVAPSSGLEDFLQEGNVFRATGLVGHWTGLGFYACALMAICIAGWVLEQSHGRASVLLPLACLGSACMAASTVTFSVLLTLFLIFICAQVVSRRLRRLLVLPLLGMVAFVVASSAFSVRLAAQSTASRTSLPSWVPNTLAYRWRVWQRETIPAIIDRPLLGWGTDLYDISRLQLRPRGLVWPSAESQWLFLAVSSGVVVALLIFFVVVAFLGNILGALVGVGPGKVVALSMFGLTMGALLASFTVPVFTNRGLPAMFWPLVGISLAVMRDHGDQSGFEEVERSSGSFRPKRRARGRYSRPISALRR